MPFLQIRVLSKHPEFAEELLLANGAQSVSLIDAGDEPVLEPAPGATPLWSRTVTIGLFPATTETPHVIANLREYLPDGEAAPITVDPVEDRDWVRNWIENCPPMKFGRRLWVCPHQRIVEETGCATLLLDPGLAFGTGAHPSTALCLEWLAGQDRLDGKAVLDFGCGSGILGIAALKLGAARCTAVDIDPQAILATRDNAEQNGVDDRLRALEHDATFSAIEVDIVLANILARPLMELAPTLGACVRRGGALVLAGLLDRQAREVRGAYDDAFDFEPDVSRDGWTRLVGRRR
jgi:ribosomal protein L11 methyltransferase